MQLGNVTVEAIEEMHSRQLGSLHKQCHAWRDNGIVYKDAKRVHDSVAVKLIEYGINHKSALEPQGNVPDRGLYLVPPHGKLIADGRKTAIVNKARLNLTGRWVLVSGKQAFGVITVGEPESTLPDVFAERFQQHRVREKEREKWWPDRQTLYLYEIKEFEPFKGGPLAVQVPPGVHFKMGNVKLDGVAAITAPQEPQQKPQQKMRTDNILEQLSDLPEKFVWVPDFVSITGLTIYAKGREPNDVDVILRAEKSGDQFELRLPVDAGFALKLERVLKDALKVESVQYTGNQYGPNWKSLPLYNLCLVKVPKLEYRELDEAEFAKQQHKELKGGAGDNQLASPKKTQVPKSEVKRRQLEKAIQVKPNRIEPALSTNALNRLLRGTNASTRRQAMAGSDEDLDAVLTRSRKHKVPQKTHPDENGTVEYPPMESDDLTTADKSRPSRTRCMECDKSPVVDVHWADGRGRAWFCLKCFKGWLTTEEGDREVVRAWFLPDGTVPKKMGDDSSVQIRKLGEGLGSSKIVARLEKLLSAAKSAEATSDGKVKVQKDDVAVAASVLLADKALKDYPDENVKLCYVAQSHSRDKSSHLDLRFEYKRGSANYLRGWTVTHQPDPGEPIPAGATREFPGVFDIVAKGECSWGAQKPFFNEWFLDGNWKGRWTFRLVQREGEKFYLIETGEECKALMEQLQITAEDLKSLPMLTKQDVLSPAEEEPQTRKGAYWILLQPLDQRPYVLGKEAVSKGWLPPKTVSCLPKEVRASVPKNLQYWMMDGENALEARRELAGGKLGGELKGGSGSGWFGPPKGTHITGGPKEVWKVSKRSKVSKVTDQVIKKVRQKIPESLQVSSLQVGGNAPDGKPHSDAYFPDHDVILLNPEQVAGMSFPRAQWHVAHEFGHPVWYGIIRGDMGEGIKDQMPSSYWKSKESFANDFASSFMGHGPGGIEAPANIESPGFFRVLRQAKFSTKAGFVALKTLPILSDGDLAELYTLVQDVGAVQAVKAIEDELIEREKDDLGNDTETEITEYDELPDGPKDLVI